MNVRGLVVRVPHDESFWWNDVDCERCAGRGWVQRFNGQKARAVRQSAGLTLRELARRTGYSAAFVSDVERGNRSPSPKLLETYLLLGHERRRNRVGPEVRR